MTGRAIGFLCVAVLTLISAYPLTWTPLSAAVKRAAPNATLSGTIWRGQVKGLAGVAPIGFHLSPSKFIGSGHPLRFSANGPGISLRGTAGVDGVKDVTVHGPIYWMLPEDPRFGGLRGTLKMTLSELNVPVQDITQGCTSAIGTISTDVLARNRAKWNWAGPELSGPIRCDAGKIISVLTGADTWQAVRATILVDMAGTYRADISVTTHQAGAELVLPLYGFTKAGREFVLTEQGQWR